LKHFIAIFLLIAVLCSGGCTPPQNYKPFQILVTERDTGQPVTTGRLKLEVVWGGLFCRPVIQESPIDTSGRCAMNLPMDEKVLWMSFSYQNDDHDPVYVEAFYGLAMPQGKRDWNNVKKFDIESNWAAYETDDPRLRRTIRIVAELDESPPKPPINPAFYDLPLHNP
jgi:hypothetical protein